MEGRGEGGRGAYRVLDEERVRAIDGQGTELLGLAMEAVDIEVPGRAGLLGKPGQGGCLVHAVLGHVPVGGPLPSGDVEKARGIDVDRVVARDGRGVPCLAA